MNEALTGLGVAALVAVTAPIPYVGRRVCAGLRGRFLPLLTDRPAVRPSFAGWVIEAVDGAAAAPGCRSCRPGRSSGSTTTGSPAGSGTSSRPRLPPDHAYPAPARPRHPEDDPGPRRHGDGDIGGAVQASLSWRGTGDLPASVPGTGGVTARTLVAELPELGHLDRGSLAALVGVASIDRDSGRRRGQRAIAGGRTSLRDAPFTATLVAVRHDTVLKAHHDVLVGRGRPGKVAFIARSRCLAGILDAIIPTSTSCQPCLTRETVARGRAARPSASGPHGPRSHPGERGRTTSGPPWEGLRRPSVRVPSG